jgi:hypothetical protein
MFFNSIENLIKVNVPEFPVVIPTFNNPTYLKKTVDYFSERGFEIIVLDNASTYPPMLELLFNLSEEDNIFVVALPSNYGPRYFYENKNFYSWLPNHFFATDPDLEFNKNLKKENWLELIEVSRTLGVYKVAAALTLDIEDSEHELDVLISSMNTTVRKIESGYYENICMVTDQGDTVYIAPTDTTMSLYNKEFEGHFMLSCVRVSGKFDTLHYGWLTNPPIPKEEKDYYTEACRDNFYSSGEVVKRGQGPTY